MGLPPEGTFPIIAWAGGGNAARRIWAPSGIGRLRTPFEAVDWDSLAAGRADSQNPWMATDSGVILKPVQLGPRPAASRAFLLRRICNAPSHMQK